MTGTSLVPLVFLFCSVFSSQALQTLLSANKVILALAALSAIVSILEDDEASPYQQL